MYISSFLVFFFFEWAASCFSCLSMAGIDTLHVIFTEIHKLFSVVDARKKQKCWLMEMYVLRFNGYYQTASSFDLPLFIHRL